MKDNTYIFMILFLMLGPFKIIGPFTRMTKGADPLLARRVALRSILISSTALLLASLLGKRIMSNFDIPIPILALTGGMILFLVALLNVIRQFSENSGRETEPEPLRMEMAMYPLAFPTTVTPYGIAAVIVFMALIPGVRGDLTVGLMVFGIMLLNLTIMLLNRYIFKVIALVLPVLGAILSVVQVALGLQIMYKSLLQLIHPLDPVQ